MPVETQTPEALQADYMRAKAIMRSAFSRRRLSNAQAGKVIGTLDKLIDALTRRPQSED